MVSTSLFTGLSGLRSNQTFIEVVGNNLANANTPGFWGSRTSFSDLLSQTIRGASEPSSNLGGLNAMQVGLGTRVASIDSDIRQGAFVDTGRPFDLAIDGNGFFALSDGVQSYYTRVGTFGIDAGRDLCDLRTGLKVQSATGASINIPATDTIPGLATGQIDFQGLLPAKVSGPLPEVLGSATPFKEGTAAAKGATFSFPADLSTGAGDSFSVSVNGASRQVITLNAAQFGGNLSSVSFAQLKSGIEGQLTGASVVQTAGGYRIETDAVGTSATIQLQNVTNAPLALLGLDSTLASGTETAASSATALDQLVGNTRNYVNGDKIQIAGRDADGQPIGGTFTYGTDGTTLGSMVSFVQGLYSESTVALGTDGKLTITANATGDARMTLSITDDPTAGGESTFPTFAVSQEGAGPDQVTTSINVFDSLGRTHPVTLEFTRTAPSVWSLEATMPPGEGTIVQGTLSGITFNGDGSFQGITGSADTALQFDFPNAGGVQSINVGLGTPGSFDGVSMVGDQGTAAAVGQDGYGAGELVDIAFDPKGQVKALYSNGQDRILAALRIAMFSNPGGMTRVGDTLLVESPNSGSAILSTATAGGAGAVASGQLEGSNVDISEQFVKLIEGQRGFQASARVITTSDEMLAEVMNLVR